MSTDKTVLEERIKQLERELEESTGLLTDYKKQQEEFLLIASHDLQAPLRKLLTFTERLTTKFELPEEAKTYTDRIQAAAASMRSLINNLASLSHISEGRSNIEKCDLNVLLHNVIKDLQADKVSITTSTLPVVEGNCIQLKHLLQNIIDNAIKFQKKDGSLQIVVEAKQITGEERKTFNLPADRTYHKIELMDNGIGFEDKYAEKIFQPFQRLHGKAEYEGNGLGLAICKKITEKHKGILYAESKESGARFILILPETSN